MKLKFTRDFYNPLTRKTLTKGSQVEINVDKDSIPLNAFWRGILKDNDITNIVEVIETNTKKKNK
jgi:hypothetical protein